MRKRDIAEVVIRLIGLIGVVRGILIAPYVVHVLAGFNSWTRGEAGLEYGLREHVAQWIGTLLVYVLGGLFLWVKGAWLAAWLAPEPETPGEVIQVTLISRGGFAFCLRLLGVYFLITTVPGIMGVLKIIVEAVNHLGPGVGWETGEWPRVGWEPPVRLVLALVLIFAPTFVASLLWRQERDGNGIEAQA